MVKFEANLIGYVPDDEWRHYSWNCQIGGQHFAYRVGTGHATERRVPGATFCAATKMYVKIPTAKDVLECLRMDARAAEQSYDEFCSEFGYNPDSMKAHKIYMECIEVKHKLKKAGINYYEDTSNIE